MPFSRLHGARLMIDLDAIELAILRASANEPGSEEAFQQALGASLQRLVTAGFVVADGGAVGFGFVVTEAGRQYLASRKPSP